MSNSSVVSLRNFNVVGSLILERDRMAVSGRALDASGAAQYFARRVEELEPPHKEFDWLDKYFGNPAVYYWYTYIQDGGYIYPIFFQPLISMVKHTSEDSSADVRLLSDERISKAVDSVLLELAVQCKMIVHSRMGK